MAVKTLCLVLIIAIAVSAVKKSYEGYKVYKVTPKSQNEIDILVDIQRLGIGEFWEDNIGTDRGVKVMVSRENQPVFLKEIHHANMEAPEVIEDLQRMIDDHLKPAPTSRNAPSSESLLSMTWDRYYNLTQIYAWFDELEATYPNIVTVKVMGLSNENREIKGIIINHRPERSNKLIGMIEGTLHAREWIAPATISWFAKELLTSTDPAVRALAEDFEWHLFPIVNPDGYEYSFTDNRMWRKNRNVNYGTTCGVGVDDDMSNGVDLNRNFGHKWMTVGASNDPCSNTFAGSTEFSEPESRSISQYVLNLKDEGELIYYFAIHSFTQLIVIPYSHVLMGSDVLLANNYADTFEIAIRGAEKAEERFGTQYRAGISAAVMYRMSGTSFDWVKYVADVPVTFLFELRDLGEYGFLLPADQIIPNNLETMDMLLEIDRTTREIGLYYSGTTSLLYSVGIISSGVILALFVYV